MHYYIDGYNLLFRTMQTDDELADKRQSLIEDLNIKVQLLELEVTLVFDSHYQPGESTRSHYAHLEILFSAHGETADELILEEIKSERYPSKKTVVTSDKKLAWFARRCSAKTESVEQFLEWLNKRYKNKIRQKLLPDPRKATKNPKIEKIIIPVPAKNPEECFDFYLDQFQKRFEVIEEARPKRENKQDKAKSQDKSPKKQERKLHISDAQRWQQAFERKIQDSDDAEDAV
jgi:uncharacterized protein